MASCTMAQLERWNAKLNNGYHFDVQHFLIHNEKQAYKKVPLTNGKVLRGEISWEEVRDGFRYTGRVRPVLHLSIWEPDGDFYKSYGLGATVEITQQTYNKRNWNEVAKLTLEWDDEKLLKAAQENMGKLNSPFLM